MCVYIYIYIYIYINMYLYIYMYIYIYKIPDIGMKNKFLQTVCKCMCIQDFPY